MSRPFPPHRPPWWPENEAWPPHNNWRRMRGRFFWRVGALLTLLFVFAVGGCALAFWLGAMLAGMAEVPRGLGGPMPMMGVPVWRVGFPLFVLVGVLGTAITVLALRRTAAPVGDVMDAAGRVAAGDYTVRVAERGPGEAQALARAFNTMTANLQMNDEQRRRLLADVTHELRTPLAVIQGNLEALLDGVYPRDDGHLAPILEETRVLARLIEDLRTLSLVESGALKLQREPTDLDILIEEVVTSFRAQADAGDVQLQIESRDDMPLLDVDPMRIREVLANLVSNALRYTPPGGAVTVSARLSRPAGSVEVAVRDTGAGVPADVLPHIFDRFYKSDESRGMGLGLAIARNLVAAHGGAIAADSFPGQGTTIRFNLPAVSV